MTKHFSQLLTLFALLIFAAQGFASSGVLCKMVAGSSQNNQPTPTEAAPCHTQNHTMSMAPQPGVAPPSSPDECFYCSHKLCNTSAYSAQAASSLLWSAPSECSTPKPRQHIEHFSSINMSAPYRPPIKV